MAIAKTQSPTEALRLESNRNSQSWDLGRSRITMHPLEKAAEAGRDTELSWLCFVQKMRID